MNPELEQVGDPITSRHKLQGWSQEYLAKIFGLNKTALGQGDPSDSGVCKQIEFISAIPQTKPVFTEDAEQIITGCNYI